MTRAKHYILIILSQTKKKKEKTRNKTTKNLFDIVHKINQAKTLSIRLSSPVTLRISTNKPKNHLKIPQCQHNTPHITPQHMKKAQALATDHNKNGFKCEKDVAVPAILGSYH